MLDAAVTELGTFSNELGTLLANNRTELDRTVTNIAQIVEVVRTKLPVLDGTVERLDDAFRVLFNSARNGEWLNQTIPCGRVIAVEVPVCIADADAIGVLSPPARVTRPGPTPSASSSRRGSIDEPGEGAPKPAESAASAT